MCKMMGSTPKEEEIPYNREDLFYETQLTFHIYDKLPAKWDGFAGQYLGKELLLLPILLKEYNIDSFLRKYMWEIIPIIDGFVAEDIARKLKSKTKLKDGTPGG